VADNKSPERGGGALTNLIELFELHSRSVYATAVAMLEDIAS